MIKIGDEVIPKKQPLLKGKVIKIGKSFDDKPLYILENRTMWIKEDLK